MRLIVILLVSFVVHTSAEVLQVKCGFENCERPANRAVTTLRYVPDKPYKLQIYAVNSEVEIFGETLDLYYIRYGRSYGFLPKNHLREKARGVYNFAVEIDLGSRKFDQTVREQNFLFEFLKPSQVAADVTVNNTVAASTVNETLPSQDNVASANEIPQGVPLDAPVEAKQEVENKVEPKSEEADDDSGFDEEDSEEDSEDDDEEESEEEIAENLKKTDDQPELVAIPPGRNTEKIEDPKQPLALPVAASMTEELKPEPNTFENSTAQEVPKPVEIAPEVLKPVVSLPEVPIKNAAEVVQPVENPIEVPKPVENLVEVPKPVEKPMEVPKPEEKLMEAPKPVENVPAFSTINSEINPQVQNNTENLVQETTETPKAVDVVNPVTQAPPPVNETFEEIPKVQTPASTVVPNPESEKKATQLPVNVDKVAELVEIKTEPAPVTEEIDEFPLNETQIRDQVVIPEVRVEAEIIAQPTEKTPEALEVTTPAPIEMEPTVPQFNEQANTPPPQIEVPGPSDIPASTEEPASDETISARLVNKKPPDPDALLQRFNEKLGHRIVEGTGKGSIESLHKPSDHSHHGHDHSHQESDHSHDSHDHSHDHPHAEHNQRPQNHLEPEAEKPGFFAGLFSRFFSDKDDSEQHFHKVEEKIENIFTTTEKSAEFCEKIDSENCPQSLKVKREENQGQTVSEWKSADDYMRIILNEAIDSMDLIISLSLTSLTVLIFTLGYYCICNARKEGPMIAKMNELERHLMASTKENEILKGDIVATKQKLLNIEDNSFGSNDMVIALKQDLEEGERIKNELVEKVSSLEKELEAAAEDGLELNRMVSELLNNQTGSDSIISSVEDLQRQLNEQQETIMTMNDTIAVKSRENSELQIQLSETNGKFSGESETFQQQNDAVSLERNNLQIELENLKRETDVQVNQLVDERNSEVTRLNNELTSYAKSYEEAKKLLNTAEARVQALDECMKAVKKDSKGGEFKDLFDIADLKADLLAVSKEKSTIQEQLQNDQDSRKLLEDRVKLITEEMSNLKKEFGVAEKEKLEAQTRLDVLSTYFKEKETQLQQELSVKEARWMQQQGETTSTVEKIQLLNNAIQTLKSNNDSLKAEIEAQIASSKVTVASHEAQSHAAWLNARQAERRLEESRMEAAALRRRLTSIAENPAGAGDSLNGLPSMLNEAMNSIPSPIRVESPNHTNPLPPAPMMMPPFLPQGFMPGAPPPFLPPPPFMPGQDMMGPPLGRLMSPPPKRFTREDRDDRDRYSPRGRGRYTPDSRYDDYTEMETDYSPPPSPSPPPRRGFNSQSDRSKKSKGGQSSTGSLESNSTSRRK